MYRDLTIEDFPILKSPYVHMVNEVKVMRIINKMLKDGRDSLQIVTDFDLTLTKQHVNGKPILSSFGVFAKCKQLPAIYAEESKALYMKYRPIEVDPDLPIKDKIAAMEEWMEAARRLLSGFEFEAREIDDVAKQYGTDLRDGTKALISRLHRAAVPVLVFSAGLGDVVEAVLRHHDVLLENVKVISNFLKYNGKVLDGFTEDTLIHVFNKNEHVLRQDYFDILAGRHNVLLMGDTIGDATMADGIDDSYNILKIGFLYDRVEDSLPTYTEAFDIVLVDDQTMHVPTAILKPIL